MRCTKTVYTSILKSIVLNQLRQQFSGVEEKLRSKLGLKLPTLFSSIILVLSQNTFFLFFVFFFESLTNETAKSWIIVAVLLFNFILPSTMARQNASRIPHHPVNDLLWQSQGRQNQLLNVVLLAEVFVFWLNEILFHAMALYILLKISSHFIVGIALCLGWVLLVSSIYFLKLKKIVLQAWNVEARLLKDRERFYLLKVLFSCGFVWLLSKIILPPFMKQTVSVNMHHHGLLKTLVTFSQNIKVIFVDTYQTLLKTICINVHWLYGLLTISIVCYVCATMYYFYRYSNYVFLLHKNTTIPIPTTKSNIFKFYRWLGQTLHAKQPWIVRDLLLFERMVVHTKISQKTFLLLPPAICTIIGLSIFLIANLQNYVSFVFAFWFVCWMAISQTVWVWLWNYPILHPSSELRQIDLVRLTPNFTMTQYMESKTTLVRLLLFPVQCIVTFIFIIACIIMNGSFFHLCIALIASWLLFSMNCLLSTYWMRLCSRFDYDNMFMIRFDTYESKVLHAFFTIPKRVINGFLCIVFFIGVFMDHSFGARIFYDIFIVIVILWGMSLFLSKRKTVVS